MTGTTTPLGKPTVVIACPPAAGHTTPLLVQATHLTARGYSVHFIAGAESESAILKTGATFYPVETVWTPEKFKYMFSLPEGHERRIYGIKGFFVDATPGAMRILRTVLEDIRSTDPDRDVVILQEYTSMGVWPFLFGAPLPRGYTRFPKVITFSTTPMTVSSIDLAPFGPGLSPDSSVEGRKRNRALYEEDRPVWDELTDYVNEVFGNLGTTVKVIEPFFDFLATGADLMLQPCSPSLEYPRSDMPKNVRFIGAHPRKEIGADGIVLPEWWGGLLAARDQGKKVVFVSQGTFQLDYNMLLRPTIQALSDRDDCFVIGVLGVKGATLDGVSIPANTQIVDFLPYDAVLPYVDVFVSNAGYGGFLHGVMNGVPMVLAGSGQDKSEVCTRGEWAGIAVNLKTDTPSVDAIRDAVDTVLTDTKFKKRCVEIQRENEALDSRAQVERAILEFARA